VSQDSVNLALVLYNIEIPDNANFPKLDGDLTDRGLTTMHGLGTKLQVTVGPSAFSSWPLLGSTLAHELEVHCNQNFAAIRVMDLAGLDGTGSAEREAYRHEIKHAKRFGLSPDDQRQISYTMNFFYPEQGQQKSYTNVADSLKSWIAQVRSPKEPLN